MCHSCVFSVSGHCSIGYFLMKIYKHMDSIEICLSLYLC